MPPVNPSTPSSPEEAIRNLESAVAALSAQVAQLERRVSGVEQRRPDSTALPVSTAPKLESRFGLTLVNRAGAITLAIGIIFFLKYAADNEWIGAEGRVTAGVLAGLAMLGAAEWMRHRLGGLQGEEANQSVFTQGLAGCGLAIIYVSLYACFAFYNLIVPAAGWALLVLVAAVAVTLSVRYASSAVGGMGFAMAMLTPVLLHNKATPWGFDLAFILLAASASLALAGRQGWRFLIPWSAGFALVCAGVRSFGSHPAAFGIFAALLGLAHIAVSRSQSAAEQVRRFAYLTAHGCFLVAGVRLIAFWASAVSSASNRYSLVSALESLLLGVYGVIALALGIRGKSAVNRSLGLVLLGIVIVKLYAWDVWQLNRFYRVSAFVALGVLLLGASYLYSRFRSRTS